jgi:hypothetical protein
VAQVEAAGLNGEEMALVMTRFKTALKGHKDYSNKKTSRGKCPCFKCGKTGHFIANDPDNDYQEHDNKGMKMEKKKFYRKKGEEWDSDCSSFDSDDEGLTTVAFDKSSLFPNERHNA